MQTPTITSNEQDAIGRVIERASVDREVRNIALADGTTAVRQIGGAKVAEGVRIEFVERPTDGSAVVVMPRAGTELDLDRLSQQERTLIEPVLRRAMSDEAYRARAAADPHAAIQEATGVTLPATIDLKFYDQGRDTAFVAVLPPFMGEGAELSADELDAVAGGAEAACDIFSCTITVDIQVGIKRG